MQLSGDEVIVFVLERNLNAGLSVQLPIGWLVFCVVIVGLLIYMCRSRLGAWKRFEIDQAKLGLGNQTIVLRPNATDRQIAYRVWVELSTRKLGLPIDLDQDVIVEVYNSWYTFFAVTRELIKDVPASKLRRQDTQQIIRLSIEVLNVGLRPHLTKWQARFRHWYDHAIAQARDSERSPQDVQRTFPEYLALRKDMEIVNQRLISYREQMYELARQ